MNIPIDFEHKIEANFGERGKQWLSSVSCTGGSLFDEVAVTIRRTCR